MIYFIGERSPFLRECDRFEDVGSEIALFMGVRSLFCEEKGERLFYGSVSLPNAVRRSLITVADYWLGRALVGLGDRLGAIEAYESALSQQLLYPARGEVEKILKGLKGKGRKGLGS